MPIGDFPGNVEATKLSRDDLSREIGRTDVLVGDPNRPLVFLRH